MMVVIAITGMLVSLLLPAINMARAAARSTACQHNLRQFGIGFMVHAENHFDRLCSGAFDWELDGSPTEIGWVVDQIKGGTLPGKMLCPSNPGQVSETYNSLLNFAPAGACVDYLGSPEGVAIDGTTIRNAARQIIAIPPGADRAPVIEEQVLGKHFNTNYVAAWFLVRSGIVLDQSGNFEHRKLVAASESTHETPPSVRSLGR